MKKLILVGNILFFVFFFGIIIYALLGVFCLPSEKPEIRTEFQQYTENWNYVSEDGKKIPIEIPAKLEISQGQTYRIENVIPVDVEDDMYFIFRTARQNIKVYVDGKLRTELSTDRTRLTGKYNPTYYVMAQLTSADAGKTIVAEYQADNRNSGSVGEIYYANYTGFFRYEYRLQGLVFVIGVIMLLISIMTLIMSFVASFINKKSSSLMSISVAILGMAIWILSNSVFRQFMARNVSAISDVSFVVLPLIVGAFSIYANQIMGYRYSKAYYSISCASFLVAIVTTVLHVLRIVDFMESFAAIGIVFVLLLATTIITLILETVHGYVKEYMTIAIALLVAGICMLIQMVIYLKGGKAYDVSVAEIGMLIMLILATADTIKDVYKTYADRDRARYENQAKSQFLASMSHEIRTPINAILGMNTMVIRKSQDEEILEYAGNIERASNNLLSIVNDILDFSKIESGKMDLVPVSYEFSDIINDLYHMIHPKVVDKKLELVLDIDENIPKGMWGDDVRIKQILINLLTNAVKYTSSGKITLQIYKNEIENLEDQVSLHFAVIDTGDGIKEEDISKLTEKFVRIEEKKNRNIEGTGLGINIVVSLLDMMDSKLEVESTYGEGSNFYFDLVQKVTNSEKIGNVEQMLGKVKVDHEEYAAKLCIPDARLLVVDDTEMNLKVFTYLTREFQCKVDAVDSGKKCLELVKKQKYDIIFMDHMMPEMDGVEVFHHMKEYGEYMNSKTPVVVLTANAINGAEEEYMAQGFDGYLAKPIKPAELENMIRQFIKS